MPPVWIQSIQTLLEVVDDLDRQITEIERELVERAMEVELTDHLGYAPHAEPPGGTGTRATAPPPSG